jgi:hypothetical protein
MKPRWANSAIGDDPAITLAAFQNGLTVDLIATKREHFTTCAKGEPLADVVARNRGTQFDFLPVTESPQARKTASIVGLIEITRFMHEPKPTGFVAEAMRPLSEENLIGADASILTFIRDADHQRCRLIVSGHEIAGLVCLSDLQRLPVRAALFGLVTCLEIVMAGVIRKLFNGDSWLQCLSEGRRLKLQAEMADARNDDGLVDPLLFTQFADKATILRKGPNVIRGDRSFRNDFKAIQALRDHLAHANDYAASAADARNVCAVVRSIDTWIVELSRYPGDVQVPSHR